MQARIVSTPATQRLTSTRLKSLVLVHGAATGPCVFDGWSDAFPGVTLEAVDLHAGLNVAEAGMANYEACTVRAAEGLPRPLALLGWSMGGLVAMLAARRIGPEILVLLEPSAPAGVPAGPLERAELHPHPGLYDGEEVYGPFPPGVRPRPESALARAERKRGLPVTELPASTLVVYGDSLPQERGRALAHRYGAAELHLPDADHWALVREPTARLAIAAALERVAAARSQCRGSTA